MKTELIYDAAAEPITLSEACAQCRIDNSDSNPLLRIYIAAAREYIENWAWTSLSQATYAFYFDEWAPEYKIYYPINSIDSFEYKNADNTGDYDGLLTDYHYSPHSGLIVLGDSAMDDLYEQPNAVKITASVGNENTGKIAAEIKLAMLLMIGHWYENRENTITGTVINEIPLGARDLLASCRDHRL